MKKLLGLLLGAAFTLSVGATPAGATAFVGTLGVAVGTLGTLPFVGAGSGTSTANNVTIQGGAAVKGNLGGGPLTLVGVPFFTNHTPSSGAGNVGLGIGGNVLLTIGGNPNVYLNVFNTNWSEGMKTVAGLQNVYVYHFPGGGMVSMFANTTFLNGTAMYTGTDARTPGGLGQVTLVSPTKVVTNLTGGLLILVTLGKLTLNFVPEPGTLLLLGSGVAGLAALGRRRMRRD
jgi:hypothetical protein